MESMDVEYFFNNNGSWIAFKKGKYLFNTQATWIGWFPKDNIAVDTEGRYLGSIYKNDRLLVDLLQKRVPYPGYPGYPEYPGLPAYPGFKGYCGYIPNTKDVSSNRLR